jgi:hypothetical protein
MAKRGRPRKQQEEPTTTPDVVEQARAQLAGSVMALRTAIFKTGPLYGNVVRAVMVAMQSGMKRQTIAGLIATAWRGESTQREDVSKGIGARYVILARLSMSPPQYAKNERVITGPVLVSGKPFLNPLAALDSGQVTFTATYGAFRRASLIERERQAPPRDAFHSAVSALTDLTVPVLVDTQDGAKIERKSVQTDLDAFVGALAALVASPVAQQVTTVKQRRMIVDLLTGIPGLNPIAKKELGQASLTAKAA